MKRAIFFVLVIIFTFFILSLSGCSKEDLKDGIKSVEETSVAERYYNMLWLVLLIFVILVVISIQLAFISAKLGRIKYFLKELKNLQSKQ